MASKEKNEIRISKSNLQPDNLSMYNKNDPRRIERLKEWITFYRRNLDMFVTHYLGIKLFPFQRIILYLMGVNDRFVWISARANSKSFTTALYCVSRCILYPNTKMVIVAKKLGQAALIITEKIDKELCTMSPALKKEIKIIHNREGQQDCVFNNGSSIKVVTLSDNSRGERSNCIIFEEFRLLDKRLVDSVIIPFNISRKPPYTKLDEYKDYPQEQSQQIFISSAYWKNNWISGIINEHATRMCNHKKSCVIANDMYLAIESGIKTKMDILGEKNTMDDLTFRTEYLNEMIGETNNAYFTLNDFNNCRKIKEPFYPIREKDYGKYNHKNNPKCPTKLDNEIRVLAIDIAMKGGKENDNTIIHLISAKLEDYGYHRDFVYTEAYNGKSTSYQALRIKQLFYEFNADYIVLDTMNAGVSVFDELSKETIDFETGEHYAPMTILNDDNIHVVNRDTVIDLRTRAIGGSSAIPVIFPIQGTLALNSAIAIDFKKQLEDKKIWLCSEEQNMVDVLMQSNKAYREGDRTDREFYLRPFIEHSELIKECINLEMVINSGNIKLQEPRDGRKDRYSAASYGNFFISLKERNMIKKTNNYSAEAYREALSNRRTINRKSGFKFL